MKRILLPVMLAFLPIAAMSQFSVSGKVVGLPDNEPLPGAHVLIPGTYKSAVTGIDGAFGINNLKNGEYDLRVTYIGYKAFEKHLSVNRSIQLTIQLEPTVFVEDEVIILGTRAGAKDPVTSQTISTKEISSLNLNRDIPFLLENSASVVASSDAGNGMGYSTLRVRGTDMSRINVTVNGIPLNDPESQAVFWVDLPDIASSTNSIQIQRGVGTSTNGAAAFGASINLQTENSNAEPYATLNSSYGSFKTLKNTLNFGTGLLKKHWNLEGRLSKLSTDGYVDRASVNLQSYYLSGTYTDKQNLARFTVFSGTEKTYQAWDGIPSSILDTNRRYNGMGLFYDNSGNVHFYDNETDNYRQTHYQAHLAHRFSNKLFASGALHYTSGFGYYEQYRDDDKLSHYLIDPVQLSQPYYILSGDTVYEPDSLISRCDLIRRKYLDNDFYGLTFALNYQQKRVLAVLGGSLNSYDGNHFGTVVWTQFAGNSLKDHEWYRGTGKKSDQNIYAKVNFQATDRTNLYLDLQFRHINYKITGIDDDLRDITQRHSFNFLNPKAGIYFLANSSNSLYASIAVANREPNRDNYVDADPARPLPTSETLYDLEAGHNLKTSSFELTSNIYFMYYHDQLVLTGAINDVGSAIMVNVPESYRAGVELSSKLMISSKLQWNASATLSRNKIVSFTEYVDDWDNGSQISLKHRNTDLGFSPSLLANSELSYTPLKGLMVKILSKFVGRQFIDNTQAKVRSLDPYFLNSFQAVYTIKPEFCNEISFNFLVNNILNHQYESNAWVYRYFSEGRYQVLDGYFPQAGINFMAGITLKF
jgi:iron complex outermembrane receptor protein